MIYKLTSDENTVLCLETGAQVARGTWLWGQYESWRAEGNEPQPVEGVRTLDDLKAELKAAATAERWDVETGGIYIGDVHVGTGLDDQNRLSGVLGAIALGGLESVDFKAANGWTQLTAPELQGIAMAISQHVQACFTAERAHHEEIDALTTVEDAEVYDVTLGWP